MAPFLAFSAFFLLIDPIWGNGNKLELRITPSLTLVEGDCHLYYVSAYCHKGKKLYTKRNFVANNKGNDDQIVFNFETDSCDYFSAEVNLLRSGELYGMAWRNVYEIERIENNEMSHRILFGNYFHLSILPPLETANLFYQIRVFCDDEEKTPKRNVVEIEDEDDNKTTNHWAISEEAFQYNGFHFKTFTKSSTMVVLDSELRLGHSYHIKVWATPKEWKLAYPDELPLVHYVCTSYGNGGNWQINLSNNFSLKIDPALSEEEENIYYVEVGCNGIKVQTFKTFTKSETDVVLQIIKCKTYEISVQKVPLSIIKRGDLGIKEQKELFKSFDIYFHSKVSVTNGQTYVFKLFDQRTKIVRTNEIMVESEAKNARKNHFSQKQMIQILDISDSEEENENHENIGQEKGKKSEQENECYFYTL